MPDSNGVVRGLVKLVEVVRILGTAVGFALAYGVWGDPTPAESIRILALTLAVPMCGTCAFEGLFLTRATAREKGYGSTNDDSINPYQTQNAMWFLAATMVGLGWGLFAPDATRAFVLFVVLILGFFVLSAINHTWQAIAHGNRTWQNLDRPFLAAAMVGGSLPIILSAS